MKASVAGLTSLAVSSCASKILATPAQPEAVEAGSQQGAMRYRILGRTGLKVSEIGFGGCPMTYADVVTYAFDKGINFFDTAPCYGRGASETAIGKGLKGKRDKVVVTTKWCPSHFGKPETKENFIAQLDKSLKHLAMDYVDILLLHQVGQYSDDLGIKRLQNPELFEAWETVHKAGKARFLGCSGHDSDLEEVMNHAVDCGKFDVILCRYSFLDYPQEPDLVRKAKAHGVGFVAMKTLAGAKGADLRAFQSKRTTFKQAALKWVLSNPDVSALHISINSFAQVDEYVPACGQEMAAADRQILNEYAGLFSNSVCRYCNKCEPSCPHDVRITDILRYAMYYQEYGQEAHGIRSYAKIPRTRNAARCLQCTSPCEESCPHRLPIRSLLLKAHRSMA